MFKTIRFYISFISFALVLGGVALLLTQTRDTADTGESATTSPDTRGRLSQKYGDLPLSFIENRGQADSRVTHYIQSPGKSIFFTRTGHAMRLSRQTGDATASHVVKVDLVGASTEAVEGLEKGTAVVSYFKGREEDWKTGIPTQTRIEYVRPWDGIDLEYNGTEGKLESIYSVAPHADPSQIKLRYSGQDSLSIDADGSLTYSTSAGEVRETAPIAWQDKDGQRVPVETSFKLADRDTVTFQVGDYDPGAPLTIDPSFSYATYIGGKGDERGVRIAVDSEGSAYVTGDTKSNEVSFPDFVGPDQIYNGGNFDAYVAKLNPAGTALVYAGYIGGTADEDGAGIAVDSSGNAYVVGSTSSTQSSFPVTGGPYTTHSGSSDGFIAKVNSTGTALVYCGYIGGDGLDAISGVDVDANGNAFVAGITFTTNTTFPVTVGPVLTFNGGLSDVFVAEVNAAGTALVYSGYIGGNSTEDTADVKIDSSGNAYVTGRTLSTEATFPVTVGPDLTHNSPGATTDVFVTKVNASGTGFVYSGFIGGAARDDAFAIAVDDQGGAYVTGRTASFETSFPVTVGPVLTHNINGGHDAFVAKVNPNGASLDYAGYIGGDSQTDYGFGIAVDRRHCAYVTGRSPSDETSFPVVAGPDLTFNGGAFNPEPLDAFISKIDASGSSFVYSGFIGGANNDIGVGVAVDNAANAYVCGNVSSNQASFPSGSGFGSIPGFDQTLNGGFDAFVVKIAP